LNNCCANTVTTSSYAWKAAARRPPASARGMVARRR
jgi:hypothetical protein